MLNTLPPLKRFVKLLYLYHIITWNPYENPPEFPYPAHTFYPSLCLRNVGMPGIKGHGFQLPWPVHNPQFLTEDKVEIGAQVKGKLRSSIKIPPTATQEYILEKALADETIKKHLGDSPLKKIIYVQGRILNLIN